MTGSAIIADNRGIVIGTPLRELPNGMVMACDSSAACFAVATDGAPSKGVISYTTDGTVERSNWMLIADTNFLTTGSNYYVGEKGKLTTTGNQLVGVAISPTIIRVQIGQMAGVATSSPASVPPIIEGNGPPFPNVGVVGQYYLDRAFRNIYHKSVDNIWLSVFTT